jgi:site-specific recombinase XerD
MDSRETVEMGADDMSDLHRHAEQEAAIRAHNQPILDGFKANLEQAGLSRDTVSHHVSHVTLLAEYLISYELKTLDDNPVTHVSWVLEHWYPAKVQRLSMHGKAAQAAALKKFFRWMGEAGRLDPASVKRSLAILAEFPAPKRRRGANSPDN